MGRGVGRVEGGGWDGRGACFGRLLLHAGGWPEVGVGVLVLVGVVEVPAALAISCALRFARYLR